MTERERFPDAPRAIRLLPRDHRGFPVPWFVAWLDREGRACPVGRGEPDFRVIASNRPKQAIRDRRCWVCGGHMRRLDCFVIGPMCAVNHVSSEPPSHPECAQFAARACPFLSQPRMRRNVKDLPEGRSDGPGLPIDRNPGVTLVWATQRHRWQPFDDGRGGMLIDIGRNPEWVRWYAHGRAATRAEVEASIESGLPLLREQAEIDGPEALAELERLTAEALQLLPKAA